MKRLLAGIVALAWGSALFTAGAAESVLVDGLAAQVNNRSITMGEVLSAMEPLRRQAASRYEGKELQTRLQTAYRDTLNWLIERALILDAYAAQDKYEIPDKVVEERIKEIERDDFNDDRSTMQEALSKDRLTLDEWKAKMKENIIISFMRRNCVESGLKVAPGEIRAYYEDHMDQYRTPRKFKLRMLVFPLQEASQATMRKLAEELRGRLAGGEDFDRVAKDAADREPSVTSRDWGWVDASLLRAELSAAAAKLSAGQTSEPVEVSGDLYLLKVDADQPEQTPSFEAVRDEVEKHLRRESSQQLYDAWIERLKRTAYVRIHDVEPF